MKKKFLSRVFLRGNNYCFLKIILEMHDRLEISWSRLFIFFSFFIKRKLKLIIFFYEEHFIVISWLIISLLIKICIRWFFFLFLYTNLFVSKFVIYTILKQTLLSSRFKINRLIAGKIIFTLISELRND